MGFFSKIFSNDKNKFDDVKVDKGVLESFFYYANESYPNEFLSLLDGKIIDKTLYITGLIFIPGETSDSGAVLQTGMLPVNMDYWGSIHSHPGPSAQPSGADLATFSKHGVFHMIVCLPYSFETIRAYDRNGEPVELVIGDFSDIIGDGLDDEFLEGDEDLDNFEEEFDSREPSISPNNQIIIDAKDFNNENIINIEIDEKGNIKKVDLGNKKK